MLFARGTVVAIAIAIATYHSNSQEPHRRKGRNPHPHIEKGVTHADGERRKEQATRTTAE